MTSRRYRFALDERVDADLIAAIDEIANGGPASKALIRILYEWQVLQSLKDNFSGVTDEAVGVTTGVTGHFGPGHGQIRPNLGPNGAVDDDLINEFNGIFEQP